MTKTICHNWNNFNIRQREDGYICLTDMANASGDSISEFLSCVRTMKVIDQYRSTFDKPALEMSNPSEVWCSLPVARTFSYLSENMEFSIWADDLLWASVMHPEVLPHLLNMLE